VRQVGAQFRQVESFARATGVRDRASCVSVPQYSVGAGMLRHFQVVMRRVVASIRYSNESNGRNENGQNAVPVNACVMRNGLSCSRNGRLFSRQCAKRNENHGRDRW